jgi:hypothetical protein
MTFLVPGVFRIRRDRIGNRKASGETVALAAGTNLR